LARIDHVKKLKMTTKRQVTFPVEVCEALNLAPGDEVILVSQECQGEPVWILRSSKRPDRSWMYGLRKYARGREHSLAAIRESIGSPKAAVSRRKGSRS